MNDIQRKAITDLRMKGCSYSQISIKVGLSENTIKTFCRRNNLKAEDIANAIGLKEGVCECCGKPTVMLEGKKPKRFCSSSCRNKWWNSNLDKVNKKAHYEFTCIRCHKPFTAYGNKERKYCCHECYVADRYYGGV